MANPAKTKRATPRNFLSLIRPQLDIVHLDAGERHVFADSRVVAEHLESDTAMSFELSRN